MRITGRYINSTTLGETVRAFVPHPLPPRQPALLADLERFIHDGQSQLPPLVRIALVHVQFETIHPFLDGNGRLGRLLITFLLCAEGVLRQPMLYLSLHFKRHRGDYYRLLQDVRETGNWEDWLRFFFEGVILTSEAAVSTARQLLDLFTRHRKLLAGESATVLRLPAGGFQMRQDLPRAVDDRLGQHDLFPRLPRDRFSRGHPFGHHVRPVVGVVQGYRCRSGGVDRGGPWLSVAIGGFRPARVLPWAGARAARRLAVVTGRWPLTRARALPAQSSIQYIPSEYTAVYSWYLASSLCRCLSPPRVVSSKLETVAAAE